MELLGGLLGSGGGQNLISEVLGSLLGGGGAQANPLNALLGGQSQGDSIGTASSAVSTIMNVASLAAMFV